MTEQYLVGTRRYSLNTSPSLRKKQEFDKQFDELVEKARTEYENFRIKANDHVTELWAILKKRCEYFLIDFSVDEQVKARQRIMSACKDIWAKSTIVDALNKLSPESVNPDKSRAGKASASFRKSSTIINGNPTVQIDLSDTAIKLINEAKNQGKEVALLVDLVKKKLVMVLPLTKTSPTA